MEVTRPEPFTFHTTSRAHMSVTSAPEEAPSPYVPLANRLGKFQNSLREPYSFTAPSTEQVQEVTQGHSPVLMTKLRSRRPSTVTTDEREIQEIQTAPRFKARDVDRRVRPLFLTSSFGDADLFLPSRFLKALASTVCPRCLTPP